MPEKLNWMVLWRPTRPSRTNTPKWCAFHLKGLECKSRKSRNTWSNSQIWPWNTEWSRAKANRVLPWECTGHSKHPLPTAQEKTLHMDITRWSTLKSDWFYSLQPKMEKLHACVLSCFSHVWLFVALWTITCQAALSMGFSRQDTGVDCHFLLQVEKLYTISKNKTSSWLWLRSWTPYCQMQT